MRLCKLCQTKIPARVIVDGQNRNLKNRIHCFQCVPFKSGQRLKHGGQRQRILKTGECQRCRRDKKLSAKNLCMSCFVTISRQKLKVKAVEYKGGHCQQCGYDRCVEALTFHHRAPNEKDFTISGWYIRWERIKPELDKCDLLCHNCHIETHSHLRVLAGAAGLEPAQKVLETLMLPLHHAPV